MNIGLLIAPDRESAAKALLRQHFTSSRSDGPMPMGSSWPDGMPRSGPAPTDGMHEEMSAFLAQYPGARCLFSTWLLDFGGKEWLLYQAARRAGMTGGRAKRLVHVVLSELMARIARGE